MFPKIADQNEQQMKAYREMAETDLFTHAWVRPCRPEDLPDIAARVSCGVCGEGINFGKEVTQEGGTVCRACAGERYWEPCD